MSARKSFTYGLAAGTVVSLFVRGLLEEAIYRWIVHRMKAAGKEF